MTSIALNNGKINSIRFTPGFLETKTEILFASAAERDNFLRNLDRARGYPGAYLPTQDEVAQLPASDEGYGIAFLSLGSTYGSVFSVLKGMDSVTHAEYAKIQPVRDAVIRSANEEPYAIGAPKKHDIYNGKVNYVQVSGALKDLTVQIMFATEAERNKFVSDVGERHYDLLSDPLIPHADTLYPMAQTGQGFGVQFTGMFRKAETLPDLMRRLDMVDRAEHKAMKADLGSRFMLSGSFGLTL